MLDQILKYSNRTTLAAELTKRGIKKVSGESLNRWVRQGRKLRPDVEKGLRAILGLDAKETAPDVPERLKNVERLLVAIAKERRVAPDLVEEIEAAHRAADALSHGQPRSGAPRPKGGLHPPGV